MSFIINFFKNNLCYCNSSIDHNLINLDIEKGLLELLKTGSKHAKESGFVVEEQFNTLEYSGINLIES